MTPTLLDKAACALYAAGWPDAEVRQRNPWGSLPERQREFMRDMVRAVARIILAEPTQEIMEAGIASLGADDDRGSAAIVSDAWSAMSSALLKEIEGNCAAVTEPPSAAARGASGKEEE